VSISPDSTPIVFRYRIKNEPQYRQAKRPG
jgi:hypothetical protein